MASEPAHYRVQVERLLAAAAELPAPAQDRIRMAIHLRADEEAAANVIRGTPAAHLGERFLALLRDADAELTPSDVAELEQRSSDGLAHWG